MQRSILAAVGMAFGLAFSMALSLAGCTAGPVADSLPAGMGLPAGAPARPAEAYQYPAVHDMPPPRATTPMNEEQQVKLEKELTEVRERQEAHDGAGKKAGRTTKKKPAAANNAQNGGAETNP